MFFLLDITLTPNRLGRYSRCVGRFCNVLPQVSRHPVLSCRQVSGWPGEPRLIRGLPARPFSCTNFRPGGLLMAQRHSTPVRGLTSTGHSPLFQGRFGRLFRSLPSAQFGSTEEENLKNLALLGAKMSASFDPPTEGKDPEESSIPALYTYLGQFIDHDLTFDPASSLQKQNDPDALVDFRTPAFDLDNIYGRGPDDQPYMYQKDGKTFVLGKALTGAPQVNGGAHDLQRNSQTPARALIGDPRNDENVIVSQFQGLMHRFHNRAAADNPTWNFAQIQQAVRFHYQWVLLHDFLPKVVSPGVLNDVLPSAQDGSLLIEKSNLEF